MATKIYSQGNATDTIPNGQKVAIYSESVVQLYEQVGIPSLPPVWKLLATTTAGVQYVSDAVTSDLIINMQAGASPAYYSIDTSPSVSTPQTDITASDATFDIAGLSAAQGGYVQIKGGPSSTSANAGGAALVTGGTPGATGIGGAATVKAGAGGATSGAGGVASLVGGAATAGNTAGGATTQTGGAGSGTGAGGAAGMTGGASGAGATGAGGAVSVTGGAALSVNDVGGVATIVGGAGSGTGAGGATTQTGGVGGATGAGGAAGMTGGAGGATSGAGGAATIAGGAGSGVGAVGGVATVSAGASAVGTGTTAGGAGAAASLTAAAGGAKTDTGTAAGGAGGAASVIAGAGGATANSATSAGGAGGKSSITGGAGGAASAGTGNGGAGGSLVLTPGAGGTSAGGTAGANGVIIERGVKMVNQGAQTAKTVSATLTAAEVLAGIITVLQGAGAPSALQLPAASSFDTALPDSITGDAFDFSVINISTTAAESASLTTNTSLTLVGDMDIAANSAATTKSAGRFRARKTATGAWTIYRLS